MTTPPCSISPVGPIGSGRPCLIVPLVGRTLAALEDEVAALPGSPAQMIEWRADLFREAGGVEDIVAVTRHLRTLLSRRIEGGLPLLFTYRHAREGGEGIAQERDYALLVEAVAGSGNVEFVDVELHSPIGPTVIDIASSEGAYVIASSHDFEGTPSAERIVADLAAMEEAGAHVAKVAVTPHSPSDVLTLLSATARRREDASIPLVTMAMGPLGAVSRLSGEVFGSAATFAVVGETSAPGQMQAESVAQVLDLLHAQLTAPTA